jgi:hypothetical protein
MEYQPVSKEETVYQRLVLLEREIQDIKSKLPPSQETFSQENLHKDDCIDCCAICSLCCMLQSVHNR